MFTLEKQACFTSCGRLFPTLSLYLALIAIESATAYEAGLF